jgi:HK97 family phage major capsid protein
MGIYLDRLHEQHREITTGVDDILNRAAEENRDVTDDEAGQIERDRTRLGELAAAIDHYTGLERDGARVQALRAQVAPAMSPNATRTAPQGDEYEITREFPTVADYAIAVHRATALRDPEARAAIERATAHQTTADNPGLIPRPILGPVLNFLQSSRPFINSVVNRPLPTGKFDRPVITQHVAIGKQTAEKALTDSQKMTIGTLPATAATYAGHLNISRQDVKWTSPSILQIVYDDFAAIYANVTDNDAADQFLASLTNAPVAVPDWSALRGALFAGSAASLAAGGVFPDTLWTSPDVWADMGGALIGADHNLPAFPGLSVMAHSSMCGRKPLRRLPRPWWCRNP